MLLRVLVSTTRYYRIKMATTRPNRNLEDIITCCLCFEQYDTTVNIPKALPCLHTFCAPCVDNYIRAVDDNGQEPKCPKCQREFSIPKGGAGELPTNFSVQDMIQLSLHREARPQNSLHKSREKVKHFTCKEHIDRHVIMVCLNCEIGLCIDCMKTLHKSVHNEHAREDIETYLSSYKKAVDALKVGSVMLPELIDKAQKAADRRLADTKRVREKEIDQQAEDAIQEVKTWHERQKRANYHSKITYYSSTTYYDIRNYKDFTADVQALDSSKSDKIPSLHRTEMMKNELRHMKYRCQDLSNREFCKPPVESIAVVIGKKKQ